MEILNNIFELLKQQPILSICLGFLTAVILAWIFKDVIIQIIKKKFELYTVDEIYKAGKRVYGGILTQDVIEELEINKENGKSR